MEQRQIFNVTEINKGVYRVKTQYNSYLIYADEVKGIGVYMELPESNFLIKSYKHTKKEVAINYLFKEAIKF